jgi:hypothetical protein
MAQHGDLGQKGGLHVLSGNEQLNRFDLHVEGRLDEILTLRDEEPELVAPAAVLQLADELELLVVERGDQDC